VTARVAGTVATAVGVSLIAIGALEAAVGIVATRSEPFLLRRAGPPPAAESPPALAATSPVLAESLFSSGLGAPEMEVTAPAVAVSTDQRSAFTESSPVLSRHFPIIFPWGKLARPLCPVVFPLGQAIGNSGKTVGPFGPVFRNLGKVAGEAGRDIRP
jgi:hypothetical protein